MSYFGFSQTLQPKVIALKNKKHFCFTTSQAKELAKRIEIGNYNEALVSSLSKQNERLRFLVDKQDSIITTKKKQSQHIAQMVQNKNEVITTLGMTIKQKDKKIKRGKLHKLLLTGSIIAATTLFISK